MPLPHNYWNQHSTYRTAEGDVVNDRVLIVGASIAGLTAAGWLARYGFAPTVVERSATLRAGGNGVDLRDHAVEVVDRMGVLPQARAAATDVQGMRFVDAEDRTVARIDTTRASELEIMRGDLLVLLHEAAGAGLEYVFGDSVRQLQPDADGVTVAFDHGGTRRFDLVIGADGLHSTVRRLAFGPEQRYVRHRNHYFAFANADAALGENRWMTMYNLPGRMAGIYRSGNHAQAKSYFIFRSRPLAYPRHDLEQHKRIVGEAFAGEESWRIPELLASAIADPEFYFDALSQVHLDSWFADRVVLVGDAAWCASPASGSGAELALVGAYRLAGELATAGGDHRIAFRRYQAGQRDLVRRKQQIDMNVRLMVPKTAGGRRVRNALARLPIMQAATTIERLAAARRGAPLPAYALAG
jgi:2-polyprenyl-6-methoxyphenol hydroxylase-like FAD-dependent oxidoreductase